MSEIFIDFSNLKDVTNDKFWPLYTDDNRYINLPGGAGSGKSVFCSQNVVYRTSTEKNHKFLVVRKVARTLKHSCFARIVATIREWELEKLFDINKSDLTITYKDGNQILFVGIDDPEKIKSIEGISSIWIEEASELSLSDFEQIDLRLRGDKPNKKQVLISYNPVQCFLEHYFETIDNCTTVNTTYKDNKFLRDHTYEKKLEGFKDKDEIRWKIYARGLFAPLIGQIFKYPTLIDNQPEIFDEVIYGLDFGSTQDHSTALIKIGLIEKKAYLKTLIYYPLITTDLSEMMKKINFDNTPIYADSARPDSIEELKRDGFNVIGSRKGGGSVLESIEFTKEFDMFTTADEQDLLREFRNYRWKTDSSGRSLQQPIKADDHLMDAIRGAIYTHLFTEKPIAEIAWI